MMFARHQDVNQCISSTCTFAILQQYQNKHPGSIIWTSKEENTHFFGRIKRSDKKKQFLIMGRIIFDKDQHTESTLRASVRQYVARFEKQVKAASKLRDVQATRQVGLHSGISDVVIVIVLFHSFNKSTHSINQR